MILKIYWNINNTIIPIIFKCFKISSKFFEESILKCVTQNLNSYYEV